jgi:signal transduction histidine kinase
MGGAGLGLSIARGIAQAHGGTLALASVQGQGTAATLFLPAVHASHRAPPSEPLEPPSEPAPV